MTSLLTFQRDKLLLLAILNPASGSLFTFYPLKLKTAVHSPSTKRNISLQIADNSLHWFPYLLPVGMCLALILDQFGVETVQKSQSYFF